jgi:ATP-binding cassette subfamily B protein
MGTPEENKPSFRALLHTAAEGTRLVWDAAPAVTAVLAGFTVVSSLVGPLAIWLTKLVVDKFAQPNVTTRALVPGLLAVGVVGALNRLTNNIANTLQLAFQEVLEQKATGRLLRHVAIVDMATLENPESLNMLERAAQGAGYRPANLMVALTGLLASFVTIFATASVLFALDPRLIGVVVASVLPVFVVQRFTNRWIYEWRFEQSEDMRLRYYYRNLLFVNGTGTARELRAGNLGPTFVQRYEQLFSKEREIGKAIYWRASRWSTAAGLVGGMVTSAGYVLVAARSAGPNFTAGSMAAVIAAMGAVTVAASGITAYIANIDQQTLFLRDYFGFLAEQPQIVAPAEPASLPERLDGVVFDGVSFGYPGAKETAVISDVSLKLEPGSMLALVGDNGAGKTTLVKLLLRLYDAREGSVRIGGVDVRDVDPYDLRARIGVLFQDFTNYALSVRDAVALGRADEPADDARIWDALERAQAADIVRAFDKGLDAKLGRLFSDGNELSGGQWQRIALARLIYRDADIWVLDEPTSALDPEAEAAIFAELREQLHDRMGIVISHRFSTVRIADAIAVLDDGRLIEYGTHEELLAKRGRYAELFELQAAGYR